MEHLDVARLLGTLAVMLGAAKLLGAAALRLGQPAVLGELVAGVLLGSSVLGLVDTHESAIQAMAEIGVVLLLFAIGLETDLRKLVRVGGASALVALVGVALPFALGYLVCRLLALPNLVAIVSGAALTATSVGITARVLTDLGRLQDPESQIILGAAVIDDVIGLVILTVVSELADGQRITPGGVTRITAIAFGFLIATLLLGRFLVPALFRWTEHLKLPGTSIVSAVVLAFGLAWLADRSGSALIIGAFAAGLLLAGTPHVHQVERGISALGHFFVPLFFISVGAAVDVKALNPLDPANHTTLRVGALLIAAAVAGKFAAGFAPWWFRGRKEVIGVGMIPRGEVGLIFAQMGLSGGVLDAGLFGAITMMVLVTTFLAPPLLRVLFKPPTGATTTAGDGCSDILDVN
ncbi:MAG: cation:proton antiporter [Isosphaeraceae bacterium]|nr:cation:proton antiporter [Isosphaeraceae bacterium]